MSHPHYRWRQFVFGIVSPAILVIILFVVAIFGVVTPTLETAIIDRKKEMIRELTVAAWSVLAECERQERAGQLTQAAAQRLALSEIRHLRYGNEGKDYFWITDLHPNMVMHPYRAELDGTDVSGYQDGRQEKVFVKFVAIARTQNEGYVSYLWQWKDDPKRIEAKLSFVKLFAPWGWVIGTGVYLDDVRTETQRMTGRLTRISLAITAALAVLLLWIGRQSYVIEQRRRQAERDLCESEAKYRLLVESAAEGILLVAGQRVLFCNQPVLAMLGLNEAACKGRPLMELLENGHAGTTALAAWLNKGGGPARFEAHLYGHEQKIVPAALAVSPVTVGAQPGLLISLREPHHIPATPEQAASAARDQAAAALQGASLFLLTPVAAIARPLHHCRMTTPVHEAAVAMTRDQQDALLVHGPDDCGVGLLTTADLQTRVLAAGQSPDCPVSSVMTAPLVTIAPETKVFQALQLMQAKAIHHLAIRLADGRLDGLVTHRDLLQLEQHSLPALVRQAQTAETLAELQRLCARAPATAQLLVAAGTRASHVTEYLATLGDAVLDRLVMFAQRDLGPAPVPFTFLALGSHGRREQTLATDQDNALLYADPAAGHAAVCASYFLALGVRVCDGLHATGYTYCRGEVMARNPKWCKPLGEWRALFSDWLEHSTAEALQAVNIVFDFRPAAGDDALAADLRRHLLQAAESREVFFHNLARSTLEFKPPLGFFGKIVTETGGRHPETVDLKNGLVPIVNFARVYSLQHGLAATGTLARIEQLTTAGVLLPGSAAELRVAFDTLAALRLRHQAAQVASGEAPDNRVNLHALTEIEQTTLRKVFEQITVFQAKLRLDFAGTL